MAYDPFGMSPVGLKPLPADITSCFATYEKCIEECNEEWAPDVGEGAPGPLGSCYSRCKKNRKSCWDPIVNPGTPDVLIPVIPTSCACVTLSTELLEILKCLRDIATQQYNIGAPNRCWAYVDCDGAGACKASPHYEVIRGSVKPWWGGTMDADSGVFICDKQTYKKRCGCKREQACLYVHFTPVPFTAPWMYVECYDPTMYLWGQNTVDGNRTAGPTSPDFLPE
jgi:hypothetical protein